MENFESFKIKDSIIVSLDKEECFVFDSCINKNQQILASSLSNHLIKLYDIPTLTILNQLEGHTNRINDIQFSNTNPNILCSCSSDGTIRIWDIRTKTLTSIFKENSEFWSFSFDIYDSLLASGTQGNILIWDIRSSKQIKKYENFHFEDITQVKFHPIKTSNLFTGLIK
jgi:WD40 repeat protein